MKVIAREGVRVPMEHASREYITDAEAVDVSDTVYYRRRIVDGDLTELPALELQPSAKKPAKGA
ncbi:DUF2635 domain-containing protein [Burkholderia cepacia]|uniref:DUF2635 domain-containing protein n=1 Tax=Burkholderia cepacia TaxID=292 RepID=UPI000752D9FA|nr:DUF2635 domain-containing protein [Burkholderia cepacia]KWH56303.1 hypothetical protein WM00_13725 [Burkholderia cepacia]